jgi:drug/metabolite transporter (DMT)-like permease
MGIVLGLGAALFWGLADYVAAVASRQIGTYRVVFGFHVVATLALGVIVFGTGGIGKAGWSDIPFFVFVGALGFLSYIAFYRALAIGPISIVSPIVSGYAAVTVVLAVTIGGEHLSGRQTAAIVVAFLGIVLASADLHRIVSERIVPLGIVLAISTMGLIGGFVYGVADKQPQLGWLVPIFLARAASTGFLAVSYPFAPLTGTSHLTRKVVGAVGFLALVDTAGYVSFNLGTTKADTAIVGAASSPYAVIPVILGVLLFHERPPPVQWLGIAFVIVGLVLLGLAGSGG